MAAIVKCYSTLGSKLSQLPVSDGNLIFTTDTHTVYLDMNGSRIAYTDINVLPLESNRTSILAPVEGFYYIEETNILWRYKEGWKKITPDNVSPLFFGEYSSFPEKGSENTLYVSNDATYKWDSLTSTYVCIANKTEWNFLEVN